MTCENEVACAHTEGNEQCKGNDVEAAEKRLKEAHRKPHIDPKHCGRTDDAVVNDDFKNVHLDDVLNAAASDAEEPCDNTAVLVHRKLGGKLIAASAQNGDLDVLLLGEDGRGVEAEHHVVGDPVKADNESKQQEENDDDEQQEEHTNEVVLAVLYRKAHQRVQKQQSAGADGCDECGLGADEQQR